MILPSKDLLLCHMNQLKVNLSYVHGPLMSSDWWPIASVG